MSKLNLFGKYAAIFALLFILIAAKETSANSTKVIISQEEGENSKEVVTNTEFSKYCNLNVVALRYEINIDPIEIVPPEVPQVKPEKYFNKSVVTGWTKVKLHVAPTTCFNANADNYTNFITLSKRGCKIDLENVQLVLIGSSTIINWSLLVQEKNKSRDDEIRIQIENSLESGDQLEVYLPYTLEITRNYKEDGSWRGLYFYTKTEQEFKNRWDLYHHKPLHARFMFPTFQEQIEQQKPTFKLHVARNENDGFVTISNSGIQDTTSVSGKDGWVVDHFRESPPLSLDKLTVMILQNFDKVTANDTTQDGRNISMDFWTFNGTRKYWEEGSSEYKPKDMATRVLKRFQYFREKFNRTEYPLNKLDVVALPWYIYGDYSSTNLGIAAICETFFIQEGNPEDQSVKTWLNTQVISQWLRGMVTTSPTPPNENNNRITGPIQYMQNLYNLDKDQNYIESPPWLPYYEFNVETQLLKMFEHIFSRKVIESAIVDFYLPKMAWKVATAEDFYDALQESIQFHNMSNLLPETGLGEDPITIRDIFKGWDSRRDVNYPSSIMLYVDAVQNSSSISLSLQNYYTGSNRHHENSSLGKPFPWLPVKVLTESGSDLIWLSPNASTSATIVSSDIIDSGKWILVNPDGSGYYGVKYSASLLKRITSQLNANHTVIPEIGRSYLIWNQFGLVRGRDEWEDIRGALEMSRYLGNETSWAVWAWDTNAERIEYALDGFVKKEEGPVGPTKKYFGKLMNSVLEKIGVTPLIPGEDKWTSKLRERLFGYCAKFEIPICMKYAAGLMTEWRLKPEVNPFSSHRAKRQLYCAAIAEDDQDNQSFNFLLEQLINIKHDSEAVWRSEQMAVALTCSKKDSLLLELLNNTRLRDAPQEYVRQCYWDEIPSEIIGRRMGTLMQAVYDFWMREVKNGGLTPETFMQNCWYLVPSKYLPHGFADRIIKFLEENKELFPDDLTERIESFKTAIKNEPSGKYALSDDNRRKIGEWIAEVDAQ